MRFSTALLMATAILLAGCRLSSSNTVPKWHVDFQAADSILVRDGERESVISDMATIDRLQQICVNAKWKPYRQTLPGHLGERTITLRSGETNRRSFAYTGSLWTNSYTDSRVAQLSSEDAEWIEKLFSS